MRKVDAIVVGAGAGGGVVAKELAVAGMKTLVFEVGKWPDYEDGPNDELYNMRHQVIGSPHCYNGKYAEIANCVGSGTVTYGAMGWRFMPQDFKLKSIYGKYYEGSSLEDWPITYDVRSWGVGRPERESFFAAAQEGLSHARFRASKRRHIDTGHRKAHGAAPVSHTDAEEFRAVQRARGLHTQPDVLRVCLPGECEERHAQYGYTGGAQERQLRTKDRVLGVRGCDGWQQGCWREVF